MENEFNKYQYREAKAFLKDATVISSFGTSTHKSAKYRLNDGSIWTEYESLLEAPEDDYSLKQTKGE